ncbi:MAG: hypothetical protein JWM32_3 [Verrucomicrobia bacterium]|nr:hypothetical protein [Verrucomicrobiota bacterium]
MLSCRTNDRLSQRRFYFSVCIFSGGNAPNKFNRKFVMTTPPKFESRPSWALVIALSLAVVVLVAIIVAQRLSYQTNLAAVQAKAVALPTLDRSQRPSDFNPVLAPPPDKNLDPRLVKTKEPGKLSYDQSIRTLSPDAAMIHKKGVGRTVQKTLGPVVDSLHLSPETSVKVKNLLVERRMAYNDARDAARQEGIRDPATVAQAVAVATKDIDEQVAATLGPQANSIFQRKLAVVDEENQLQSYVALDMSFAGVPLSPDQSLALAEAAKALHYSTLPSASGARMTELANPGVDVHQAMLAKAATILSPQQFELFKASQDEKLKEEALRLAEVKSLKRMPSN